MTDTFHDQLDKAFKERREENDDRYAFKKFEYQAEQHGKILYGLIGLICFAVVGAILKSIGL